MVKNRVQYAVIIVLLTTLWFALIFYPYPKRLFIGFEIAILAALSISFLFGLALAIAVRNYECKRYWHLFVFPSVLIVLYLEYELTNAQNSLTFDGEAFWWILIIAIQPCLALFAGVAAVWGVSTMMHGYYLKDDK